MQSSVLNFKNQKADKWRLYLRSLAAVSKRIYSYSRAFFLAISAFYLSSALGSGLSLPPFLLSFLSGAGAFYCYLAFGSLESAAIFYESNAINSFSSPSFL
jgi:hypothetical protein